MKPIDVIPYMGLGAFATGMFTIILGLSLFGIGNYALGFCGVCVGLGCAGIGGMYIPVCILQGEIV